MNNLLLCGFMGCGKTTVGQLLSQKLARTYIDLDAQIEETCCMKISELFAAFGEAYFRDREHEAVLSLGKLQNCIISTGGGTMTFDRNVRAVSPADKVVFLDADFETCYQRICDSDRPLVQNNSKDSLYRIFEQRQKAYRTAASVVIDAAAPPEVVAENILSMVHR